MSKKAFGTFSSLYHQTENNRMMITTIQQFIVVFLLSLFVHSKGDYLPVKRHLYFSTQIDSTQIPSNVLKKRAFEVLENKCNFCHRKRNKRRVFTLERMDKWANEIYTQVYTKKRMPRGKKNKLSTTEYNNLLTWITSLKTIKHGNKL